MIRGYVSSEEENEGDDFYSDPLVKENESFKLPKFQVERNKINFLSTLEYNKKINFFLKTIEEDYFGDKIYVLKNLLSLGVTTDCFEETQQCTPLIKACTSGKCEIVQFLLENGANPNLHKELFTPLMACCTETYIAEDIKLNCAQLLLQHGAQINAADKYHTTALMYATGSQYKSIVDLLLGQSNINVNLQDKEGMTALFYAVTNNNLELVKKLIDAGSDIAICDKNGRKAVNIALLKEFYDVAKLLGYNEPKKEFDLKLGKKNKTVSDILDELPNSLGTGGFYSDVQSILQSFFPFQLEEQKISLSSFLNSTESDLYKMGILIEYDRQKLLKCTIHKYHLKPWRKSSMPFINSDVLNIQDVLRIMSALLKHLTIINASLNYLKSRVAKRVNQSEDLSVEKDLITTLINIYIAVENLSKKLERVLKHSYQVKICTPHDFIEKSTICKNKNGIVSNKKFWCGAFTIFAAWLFCHLKQQ